MFGSKLVDSLLDPRPAVIVPKHQPAANTGQQRVSGARHDTVLLESEVINWEEELLPWREEREEISNIGADVIVIVISVDKD